MSEVSRNHQETSWARVSAGATRGREAKTRPTQSDLLIGYEEGAELFHDSAGEVYATAGVGDQLENWTIKGRRCSPLRSRPN